jgi:hypothetical protein
MAVTSYFMRKTLQALLWVELLCAFSTKKGKGKWKPVRTRWHTLKQRSIAIFIIYYQLLGTEMESGRDCMASVIPIAVTMWDVTSRRCAPICGNYTQLPCLGSWLSREVKGRSYFTTESVSQSVSKSVCLGIERPCGTYDQMLLPVGMSKSKLLYDWQSVSQSVSQ